MTTAANMTMPRARYRAGGAREILSAADRWLARKPDLYLAPYIPAAMERRARGAHGGYLPESEPVLVLYDATLVSAGADGFAVTRERLCWKNHLDHPRQIAWSDLDPGAIVPCFGHLMVAGGSLLVRGDLTARVAGFLTEMALACRPPGGGPYRHGLAEIEPAPVQHLVTAARRVLGEVRRIHYHPAIPIDKLTNVQVMHTRRGRPAPATADVAVLYDDTLLGDGEEGFVLTPSRFYWKNFCGEPESLSWDAIDPEALAARPHQLDLTGGAVHFAGEPELPAKLHGLVARLARSARG
jgi:hypothetical protein